jgi:hypothetical protein
VKLFNRLRAHPIFRYVGYAIAMLVVIVAAAIVVSLSVDLGPWVREKAEQLGSKQIERPVHIGKLRIQLFTGKVVVEDLRIDGLHKGDRPFFTAKRLALSFDWLPLAPLPGRRERPDFTITDVDLSEWDMLVEKWEDEHNFPKFSRDDEDKNEKKTERPISVTLKWLHASSGRFTYEDHEAPWSIVCPNLDLTLGNLPNYHGTARFFEGLVTIQDNLPMWANMKAQFVLDGPRVHLSRIDLDTDGAKTVARGDVDLANWPNQTYRVQSRVNFPRMREIFFKNEDWALSGDGDFTGTFSLFKGGKRDLAGSFTSELFGFGEYRFPSLYGSLRWTPTAFDVWNAGSKFYGGDARFSYSIQPLGAKVRPTAKFDASYTDVDLARFTDFERLPGMRLAGSATGRNVLEWPLGRFVEHRGEGTIAVVPPPGVSVMTPARAAERSELASRQGVEWGPFEIPTLPAHVPVAGSLTYRYGPDDVTLESGRFATEATDVTFGGSLGWGGARARIPFHVVSADWQESDQLLAGIISDFGSPTHPVSFGGRGEFEGVMTGAFKSPRVEGRFRGDDLRAWDTIWGTGTCNLTVENSYVTIADGLVAHAGSEIHADGKFSLGYPRDDGGEEIDARFRAVGRDLDSLRHAFKIDDYPVSGRFSGEFHLTGEYERPFGFGRMSIDDGVGYGEPFQRADARVDFDGGGARLTGIAIAKGTGTVTGAAYVGWDSTYSFEADGRQIPIADLAFLAFPKVPLGGSVDFTAKGEGTFDLPRNDVKAIIHDMRIGEEEAGNVVGNLELRGKDLIGDLSATSARLSVTGQGKISLAPHGDAEVLLRVHDSSLDPYVRLFMPGFSADTTAKVSGSIHAKGQLSDFNTIAGEATVDTLDMRVLDYAVRNRTPIRLSLARQRVTIDEFQLVGDNTQLQLTGSVGLDNRRVAIQATGDADLGIVQGLFPGTIRGAGRAALRAAIDGDIDRPQFSGTATIANGRIRHTSMPNALDAINGTIHFDPDGVRLDDVSATLGGGSVQFSGHIGLDGYVPDNLNINARGTDMHLRYPEDIRSIVDADLTLRGTVKAPMLSGEVTVRSAAWNRRVNVPTIYDLAARRTAAIEGAGAADFAATTVPLRFDVHISVPSTLRIDNNLARIVANADLSLRGTYDRPVLLGHADVERGEVIFEGRRYRIRRGTIDFTNPNKIEPFFDVEAETSVRQINQTYRVTVTAAGTTEQLRPSFDSDPPLPPAEVLALLLSEARTTTQDAELRALQNPNERQTSILTSQGTQYLLGAPKVGEVVEQTFALDTFQISPSFTDPYNTQTSRLNPTARVTIGKRISDRAYLTFSRSLGSIQNDQIVLLEYEASDRLSWVLSRNEDNQTFTLEFRVRHTF